MSENTETITLAAIGDLHVTEQSQNRYRDLLPCPPQTSRSAYLRPKAGSTTNWAQLNTGTPPGVRPE